MKLLKIASMLSLSCCCACSMAKAPANVAQRAVDPQPSSSKTPLQLTIKPAVDSVVGGHRLPVQFTIKNSGDQPIRTCLSSGRVVHLWGVDREYAYTVTEESADRSSCQETLDLPAHGERSWSEEMSIPAIAASSAKIVGFAQVQPEGCEGDDCQPVWLTASYAPFKIEDNGATAVGRPVLDLRTGVNAAALTASAVHHRPGFSPPSIH
jgi:hypothetical protein